MIESQSKLMKLSHRFGAEGIAWSLRRLHCPVSKDALVLEVGSGGNPYPRANVLLDAYEQTRERHWAPLKVDRPAVLGFAENLPFRDGAFDFVIASHVLEHSTDPARFLAELQRVARAGYIETPDAFMERINPYRDHRLEVTVRDDRLVIRRKRAWRVDEELVELYEHDAKRFVAGELIPSRPFSFHARFYWHTRIPFDVVNPDVDTGWPEAGASQHHAVRSGGMKTKLMDLFRALLSQRARNRTLDIVPLLRCPTCRSGKLSRRQDTLVCEHCAARYPMTNGIPMLRLEDKEKTS